jgi:hypothetical protein
VGLADDFRVLRHGLRPNGGDCGLHQLLCIVLHISFCPEFPDLYLRLQGPGVSTTTPRGVRALFCGSSSLTGW